MPSVVALILLTTVLVCISGNETIPRTVVVTRGRYRAAVFDQAPTFLKNTSQVLTRREAVKFLNETLTVYEEQCRKGRHLEGIDIIVFPEYGLAPGLLVHRSVIYPFLEEVPDPQRTTWNPCESNTSMKNKEFQERLSCMAKKYGLYLVANLGTFEPCDPKREWKCPKDGRFQYNTNVAFDPTGRLVARYRKYHTFYSERVTFDTPTTVDYSVFDTPFGRFGTFVCFDVLFREPAVTLIETWRVDSIAFSTAWINVLPLFDAVPFHAAYATALNVNFLSANLHFLPMNITGSGIYEPKGTLVYRSDDKSTTGKLLTASLHDKAPIVVRHNVTFSRDVSWDKRYFRSTLFGDTYHFVTLASNKSRSVAAVCNKDVCCHLDYEFADTNPGEQYALGAFDGLHTIDGVYYIQVCSVLKCAGASRQGCGAPVKMADTHFRWLNLTGNFSSRYVSPSLVTSDVNPAPGQWLYDGRSLVSGRTKAGLLWATLLARVYNRDDIVNIQPRPARDVRSDTSGAMSVMGPHCEKCTVWLFAFCNAVAFLASRSLLFVLGA